MQGHVAAAGEEYDAWRGLVEAAGPLELPLLSRYALDRLDETGAVAVNRAGACDRDAICLVRPNQRRVQGVVYPAQPCFFAKSMYSSQSTGVRPWPPWRTW